MSDTAQLSEAKRLLLQKMLAGGHAPRTGSGAYGRAFDAVFGNVARAGAATLAPDLLAGVEDRPGFRQADGLHPNAAGVKIIAARLAPVVARALRSHK